MVETEKDYCYINPYNIMVKSAAKVAKLKLQIFNGNKTVHVINHFLVRLQYSDSDLISVQFQIQRKTKFDFN